MKEYLETSAGLLGKDLEKGISIILVYLKLGMVKEDDVEFDKNKIRVIRKIHVKDNNVVFVARKTSPLQLSNARPNTTRVETCTEKLKRLLEQK